VGIVRGSLPLNTTAAVAGSSTAAGGDVSANVTLDEVLLTVAPTAAAAAGASAAGQRQNAGSAGSNAAAPAGACVEEQQPSFADELGVLGQIGVLEGIKLIAGGLEAVLQRLSVAATNVTVRVEVPAAAAAAAAAGGGGGVAGTAAAGSSAAASSPGASSPGAELIVHLDCIHYSDATPPVQQWQPGTAAAGANPAAHLTAAAAGASGEQVPAAVQELVKRVSVTGLTIELLQLTDEEAEGSGTGGPGQSMRCSQLLYDSDVNVAATAAALRSSFMAHSSMMRGSHMTSATAAAAAAASTDGIAAAGRVQLAADLGGLLLGGPDCSGLDLKLELRLAWQTAGGGGAAAVGAGSAAAAPFRGSGASGAPHNSSTGSQPPRITADINSSAVSIYLQPWQLPLMQMCSVACSRSSSTSSSRAVQPPPAASGADVAAGCPPGPSSPPQYQQQQQTWGQRSFVEELFFPHVEGFVADSLNLSSPGRGSTWGAGSALYNSVSPRDGSSSTVLGGILNGSSSAATNAASSMYSMYHDARSVFSSVASSISGAMAGNILNGVYSVANSTQQVVSPRDTTTAAAAAAMYSSGGSSVWQQQPQQQPVIPAAAWSVRGVCPALTVCLHYHTPSCAGVGGAPAAAATAGGGGVDSISPTSLLQQQQQQPPCFVLRFGGLVAAYDVSGRVSHVSLKLYQLEAYEQLPAEWCVVAGGAAAAAAGTGSVPIVLNPKVLGSVPRILPMAQAAAGFSQQVGGVGGLPGMGLYMLLKHNSTTDGTSTAHS